MRIVGRLVPDGVWEIFQDIPPVQPVRAQAGGRRRCDDRAVPAAIVFVATPGCTWRPLPPVFGASWQTVRRRFTDWPKARMRAKPHRVTLDRSGANGELDWSRCAIGSISVRAVEGALGGPNPADRGRPGSKIHTVGDHNGPPLSPGSPHSSSATAACPR
ncbi:transposase [Streptomyces sp. NPDC016640]|uniref:transposase n=1 Tax=Streptomyces sp. NPDC016640 TaxID=3364969 RepID=UPI0036F5B33E